MRRKALKKIIFERGMSVGNLAKRSGVKRWLILLRLMGFGEFKAWEIKRISLALGLCKNQIEEIFFSTKSFF